MIEKSSGIQKASKTKVFFSTKSAGLMAALWALLLTGCAQTLSQHQPPGEFALPSSSKPSAEPIQLAPVLLAEPISPPLTKIYPHLQGFQGALVVGHEASQLVIAGIPPSQQESWLDGILAYFYFDGFRWQRADLFQQGQLKVTSSSGDHYSPVGLLTDIGPDRALVQIVLARRNNRRQQTKISLQFSVHRNPESFRIQLVDTNEPATKDLKLELRWLGGLSQMVPLKMAGPLAQGVTFYRGQRTFTALASGAVQSAATATTFTQTLGSEAAKSGVTLVSQLSPFDDTAYRLAMQLDCAPSAPECPNHHKPFVLTATAGESQSAYREGMGHHPLYLTNHLDEFVLYTPLQPGQKRIIALAPHEGYSLRELGQQPHLYYREREQVDKTQEIHLPPQRFGTVEFLWPAADSTPVHFTLTRRDDPFALTLADLLRHEAYSSDQFTSIAYQDAYVAKGPVSLSLPPGPYIARLVNERAQIHCSHRFDLEADEDLRLRCESLPAAPLNASGLLPLIPASAPMMGKLLSNTLQEAHFLGSWNHPPGMGAIIEYDASEGMNFAWYPTSKALNHEWAQRENTSYRQLKALVEFRKTHGNHGVLEAGCASAQIGRGKLREIMLRLEPDAVQAFGCGSHQYQQHMLAVMDELMVKRQKPLYLTPAPIGPNQQFFASSLVPRMIFFSEETSLPLTQLATAPYTLAQGALLKWQAIDSSGRSLEVQVSAMSPLIQPSKLQVIARGKIVLELPIAPGGQWQQTLELPDLGDSWYRLSVLGQEDLITAVLPEAAETILASSSYFKVTPNQAR
jgi:hypothetical protein